ncbi:hypothetical protein IKF43_00320 [Candidatus Saccharibacteria bacterium]|nr:hypothetical protein [Candidatus Saccharibacteria bacterium]
MDKKYIVSRIKIDPQWRISVHNFFTKTPEKVIFTVNEEGKAIKIINADDLPGTSIGNQVDKKYRVSIPKWLREELGLNRNSPPGLYLAIDKHGDHYIVAKDKNLF